MSPSRRSPLPYQKIHRTLRERHHWTLLVLLAALLLSTVSALAATLLAAVSAAWRVTALRRTPGCAASTALLAAVPF
jgi:hypothetical protein